MKRFFGVIALVCAVAMSSCNSKFDDGDLWNNINGLEERVSKLEEQCKAMNTNIASLQTIVKALQNQKTVTKVEQTAEGCTIHFSDGTTAVIRNGKDSGSAPVVSIRQDADGNYYWTLNGDYILVDGQKVKAQGTDGKDGKDGTDGKDGQDGTDGKDGADGTNGKDGVTPQLKIDGGYWYITYDNGATWTRLGKATGENGKDGANGKDGLNGQDGKDGTNGKDGRDGDGIKVTQDDSNVYFELNDGTRITIPKSNDISSIVDKVKSITFVPQYTDGKVEVLRENEEADGSAELDFLISPKEVVTELAAVWEQAVTVKAVYTKARSTKAVKFVDMPVIAFTADSKTGVVTVKVSGENLGDDFYAGKKEANAMLFISDGNTSRTSDYVAIRGDRESIYIQFQDENIKKLCVALWDTDGDHELSREEAAAVTTIGNTFKNNTEIQLFDELKYFTGLTSLEAEAFVGCTNLWRVTIPANVESFSETTFKDCNALKRVMFDKGSKLKEIPAKAFSNKPLVAVEIPANVETIGIGAFGNCSALAEVTFEQGSKLKTIKGKYQGEDKYYGAFYNCTRLTTITIPASVETIEETAFKDCYSLKNVVFEKPSHLRILKGAGEIDDNYYSYTHHYTYYGYGAFSNCTSLESIELPASLEEIQTGVFFNCASLASLTFEKGSQLNELKYVYCYNGSFGIFRDCPLLQSIELSESIQYIGANVFAGSSLLNIYIKATTPPIICWSDHNHSSSLSDLPTGVRFYVPTSAVDTYKAADGWEKHASIIWGYDFDK